MDKTHEDICIQCGHSDMCEILGITADKCGVNKPYVESLDKEAIDKKWNDVKSTLKKWELEG